MGSGDKFEICAGSGHWLNGVLHAADGFLDAAHVTFTTESKNATRFLYVPKWHVVHHLSFLAVELYVKACKIYVEIDGVFDGEPSFGGVEKICGHHANLDRLTESEAGNIKDQLKLTLSPSHWEIIERLRDQVFAKKYLTIGRYPYEVGAEYPAGDKGLALAEEWPELATALAHFHDPR